MVNKILQDFRKFFGPLVLTVLLAACDDVEVLDSFFSDDCETQNGLAWTMTRQFVRQHLGGAQAAYFPSRFATDGLTDTRFEYLGDCRHRIRAYVDAVYETGPTKRRHFVAEVAYGGRGGWRLEDLDFIATP